MRNKKIWIISSIALASLVVFSATYMISHADEKSINPDLDDLLTLRQEYTSKGKEVPDDIKEKIKLETEFSKKLKEQHEKCEKEVAELEEKRQSNPNYGKIDVKQGNDPRPADSIKITKNPEESKMATVFGEELISDMDFTSVASTEYNILLAGCESDVTTGIIINKLYSKDSIDVTYDKLKYPAKGKITFESICSEYNIVTFSYGNNEKGYFDLNDNKAIFEEYKAK